MATIAPMSSGQISFQIPTALRFAVALGSVVGRRAMTAPITGDADDTNQRRSLQGDQPVDDCY